MIYQIYPSDLTDREWEHIKGFIPAAKPGGRSRQTDMRLTLKGFRALVTKDYCEEVTVLRGRVERMEKWIQDAAIKLDLKYEV